MYRVATIDSDGDRLSLVRSGAFHVFGPVGDPDTARFPTPVDAHNALSEWIATQGRDRVNEVYSLSVMLVNACIVEIR